MNNLMNIYILLVLIFITYINFIGNEYFKVIEIDNKKIDIHKEKLKKPVILILCSVHGNEPAGFYACKNIRSYIKNKKINGTIFFYSNPNPYGLKYESRYQKTDNLRLKDINRNFQNEGLGPVSKKIVNYSKISDLIIDLHEGWGYHIQNQDSIGSTVMTTSNKNTEFIGKQLVKHINNHIKDENKKFVFIKQKNHKKENSLSSWCEKNNKNYILIETTGQNDIQPLDLRIKQQELLINKILKLKKVY